MERDTTVVDRTVALTQFRKMCERSIWDALYCQMSLKFYTGQFSGLSTFLRTRKRSGVYKVTVMARYKYVQVSTQGWADFREQAKFKSVLHRPPSSWDVTR